MQGEELSYSIKEVAVILNVPLKSVKEHIRDGKIKVTPRGSWVRRVRESEVVKLKQLLNLCPDQINVHIHDGA